MQAQLSEDDLSCSICSELFKDPRVLPCGHSFCAKCVADWRQSSRECPHCRGNIGGVNPPKNIMLAAAVDCFREQSGSSNMCVKCFTENSACAPCRHCRQLMCPPCTDKHTRKLAGRLRESQESLQQRLRRLEAGVEPIRDQQAACSKATEELQKVQKQLNDVQAALTEALEKAKSRQDRLSEQLQQRAHTIHSARSTLAELNATAATAAADAATLGRGIEAANRLANTLDSAETGQQCLDGGAGQLPALGEAHELARRLAACFISTQDVACQTADVACQTLEPAANAAAAAPSQAHPAAASLAQYYRHFPQRPTHKFKVQDRVHSLSVCWNTRGYLFGQGRIVSAQEAAGAAGFAALPDEVVVVLERQWVPSKVAVYGQSGQWMGEIRLCRTTGESVTGWIGSLAVSSAQQLLAVSMPEENSVLVTQLDGTGKQLISRCSGLDLNYPLGVCFSNEARLYIADHGNDRICCVSCNSGDTLAQFTHGSLKGVSLVSASCGLVVVRGSIGGRLVLLNERQPQEQPATVEGPDIGGFFVDAAGGLVMSRGGQLQLISQPVANSRAEGQTLASGLGEYDSIAAFRSGRLVASVEEFGCPTDKIHVF